MRNADFGLRNDESHADFHLSSNPKSAFRIPQSNYFFSRRPRTRARETEAMKKNKTFRAAGILLLAAFFFSLTAAASPQKTSEADKQAQRGAEFLSRKDWRRAAESYQKAVRADARHVEGNYGLGVAYMNLKQMPEALAAFSNVVAA